MNTKRPRRESRIKHAYRASIAHTHVVRSRRDPTVEVTVTCTRVGCWRLAADHRR